MLASIVNILLAVTILQSDLPADRYLKNMTVTQGLYGDRIVVEWEKVENATYTVLRSQKKDGEFTVISQTGDSRFEDLTAESGVNYWYRIILSPDIKADDSLFITEQEYRSLSDPVYIEPVINKTDNMNGTDSADKNKTDAGREEINKTETAAKDTNKTGEETGVKRPLCYSGYTSIENYTGEKFDDLVKLKKEKLKIPSGAEAKKKQKASLEYIQQYYMHPIKLTLFLTMSRPYFDSGELRIITDCETFEISEDMRNVVFYNQKHHCMVIFYSKIIRQVISRTADRELVDLLLKNSELFCVPEGRRFVVDKNGTTRLVNVYEAVGLSTRFLKNDIEWKSRTIILSTSKPELTQKLRNASQGE